MNAVGYKSSETKNFIFLADKADDCRASLCKQSARRAEMIEGLLFAGDYEAIGDWLTEWKAEDEAEDSIRKTYQRTVELMRFKRGCRRGSTKEASL